MAQSERDAALTDLASRIFSEMLGEIIMDSTIQAHQETSRKKAICPICKTHCGLGHDSSSSAKTSGSSISASPAPASESAGVADAGTPTHTLKADSNIILECFVCQKSIAYNRFAQHLSSCLGKPGVRRAVARNATAKPKIGANGRAESPYVDSSIDSSLDDPRPMKGKVKGRLPRPGHINDDEPINGVKRPGSPHISSVKKLKKPPSSAALLVDRPRPPSSHRLGLPGSQPKTPSKLRSTPTPSVAASVSNSNAGSKGRSRSRSASAQSDSSEETPIANASSPSSSLSSGPSPTLPSTEAIRRQRGGNGSKTPSSSKTSSTVAVPRIPSPRPPAQPPRRLTETNYLLDVLGDETGSSSDSDDDS